ncbi:Trp biosynthesis-associated membrane protein [Georgenia sp. AZ-5]|uniref:Trp biosynthesis-associated membrane protein n=1 Tax=Georgenia sp. AZ-5 TaxID=3367526 RepID=UPI0037541162
MSRLLRRRTVVALALLLAVALLGLGALPWVRAQAPTVIDVQEVTVAGTAAAPALGAAALVVAAAALAVGIGQRAATVVGGVALLGAAALVVATTADLLGDPARPALSAAADRSGVPQLAGEAAVTAWPFVTLAAAAAVAALGVVVLVRGGRWQAAGRRFERPAQAPRGRSASTDATDARSRAMDDWDALGRGEDPSAPDADGAPGPADR